MKLKKDKVKLFVRVHPTASVYPENVQLIGDKVLEVGRHGLKPLTLVTDGILSNNNQKDVHQSLSKFAIVKNLFEGYSTCVLTYGIDEAGKSFPVIGCIKDFHQRGLIIRFISDIYEELRHVPNDKAARIKISAISLCGDNVYDLLSPKGLNLDIQSTVHNYSVHVVTGEENAFCLFFLAKANKKKMLKLLSKKMFGDWTHFIFTITVEVKSLAQSETKILAGSLKFVELAGAVGDLVEPVTKEQLIARETISILEHDLVDKHHCSAVDRPSCRRCKLSYLMKNVICGRAILILILNIRIEKQFMKSLIHTIMFGQRLLHVEIKAEPTLIPDTYGLRESLRQDVENLKLELYQRDILANRRPLHYGSLNDTQRKKLFQDIQDFFSGRSERVKVYTQVELQAAFEMVRNIHKTMQQQNEIQIKFEKEIVKGTVSSFKLSQEYSSHSPIIQLKDSMSRKDLAFSATVLNADGSGESNRTTSQDSTGGPEATSPVEEEGRHLADEEIEEKELEFGFLKKYINNKKIVLKMKKLFRQEMEVPIQRLEAFEEFKLRSGKYLNEAFLSHKALMGHKKIEFNRLLRELRGVKQEILKHMAVYRELFAVTRDPTTSEELMEIMDKVDALKEKSSSMTNATITALGEVRAAQKIGHKKRQHFLKEFDLWYENKLSVIRYQNMLGSKEYQNQGPAMKTRKSHRRQCLTVSALSKCESNFQDAKLRTKNWLKHLTTTHCAKPRDGIDGKSLCGNPRMFEFLHVEDSD
uniref:Kinesin motor domain-containing protein n=1 Tax=Strigamia maritima TaxID=126957 RepID=T1J5J4_STRMM